ncbi:class I SAM-dependent methyltransferase [Patescibacteria group bacterium]|nr:MAG: class I SAM-dependent methyltransferase [Patescibacteria group bacterium]
MELDGSFYETEAASQNWILVMDLKSTYNKIAKDWREDHLGDTWWIEGTDKYLSFFKQGASILDVGCGWGEKSKYMVKKGFDITGIDFSEEMIKLAKEQAPAGKFFVKDIRQPLELETLFDGVFAQAVLLHIPKNEIVGVLKNITAPLKSKGYFYAAVKEMRQGGKDEEIVKESDYGYDYKRFFSYFMLDELKKYIQEIRLKVVYENITSDGKTNWIQIVGEKS